MSTYEIDDEVVRGLVDNRDLLPPRLMAAIRALEAQIPQSEPDREYLVKDAQGDIWRWSARQMAWECLRVDGTHLSWATLLASFGPVTLFSEIR